MNETTINATRRRSLGMLLGAAASLPLSGRLAHAQDAFPSRPIRLIVPFAPGGGTDSFARRFMPFIGAGIGERVFVDNKPGANAIVATQAAIQAPADGYTLLLVTNSLTINPFVQEKLPYDSERDLAPISLVARTPHVLLVTNSLPVKTVRDLVEYAKAKPRTLNFGSGGIGTTNHLAGEMFAKQAGIRIEHIAYKGSAEYVRDLTPGVIHLVFAGADQATALAKAGTARPIAATGAKRLPDLPDVPTMAEAGFPLEIYSWTGFATSARTPKTIVAKLSQHMQAAARSAQARQALAAYELIGSTPEQFSDFLKKESTEIGKLLKDLNLTAESQAKK